MSVGGIVHKNLANDHEEMKALQSPKSDELQINHKLMNVTRSLRQKWRSSTTTSVGISQARVTTFVNERKRSFPLNYVPYYDSE